MSKSTERTEREQVESLAQSDLTGPFVMISLFRFKETTASGERGEHVYARYLGRVIPVAEKAGARLLWYGDARHVYAGTAGDAWDRALLPRLP